MAGGSLTEGLSPLKFRFQLLQSEVWNRAADERRINIESKIRSRTTSSTGNTNAVETDMTDAGIGFSTASM